MKKQTLKTWDTLEQGDVIEREYGPNLQKREILGMCGRNIHVSFPGNFDKASNNYTKEELIADGYEILQDTPEVLEVTQFKECDTCIKKAGSPTLCDGCLNNRSVIEKFGREVKVKN